MKNTLYYILLIAVFLANVFIRIVGLEKSQPTINWDEAAVGYNGYSLLLTGKDEWGKEWPLSIRSFSDFKPSLYSVMSVPLIKVFGLNQTSTRMLSAIAGMASLVGLWLLLGLWIKNRWTRLIIFTILSFEPWRIHFSRTAMETHLSSAFFVFGAYFLLKSMTNERKLKNTVMLKALIAFALSAYSYHSGRLAGPALIGLFIFDPIGWLVEKSNLVTWLKIKQSLWLLVMALVLVPVFLNASGPEVLTRFRQENLFSRYYPFAPGELWNNNLESWLRINPAYYLIGIFIGHMTAYLSPANFSTNIYLWMKHSVQYISEFNLLGWIEISFLIIGLWILIKNLKDRKYRFLVYWIVAGALPSALTWSWFHSLRILNIMPAIDVIIGIGILGILTLLGGKFTRILFVFGLGLFLWQAGWVINNELVYNVWDNHGAYQPGGFKEGVELIEKVKQNYDQIVIDTPHAQDYIFIAFYSKADPLGIQAKSVERSIRGADENGSWNVDFDKYKFRKINWEEDRKLKKTILWFANDISEDSLRSQPNAKWYYLKSPINLYPAGILVFLD